MQYTIHRPGELALLCEVPPPATLSCQQRIWAVASRVLNWADVVDVVPDMNNPTFAFGPLVDTQRLTTQLHEAWEESQALVANGKLVDIEVAHDGNEGPDLHEVVKHTGLSTTEAVRRHTTPGYIVYLLGFQLDFVYTGGFDRPFATPRRTEPRMTVPADSVGIGGEQTGIHPAASSGSRQLLGHTDTMLFIPQRNPPTLLAPEDHIHFTAPRART